MVLYFHAVLLFACIITLISVINILNYRYFHTWFLNVLVVVGAF